MSSASSCVAPASIHTTPVRNCSLPNAAKPACKNVPAFPRFRKLASLVNVPCGSVASGATSRRTKDALPDAQIYTLPVSLSILEFHTPVALFYKCSMCSPGNVQTKPGAAPVVPYAYTHQLTFLSAFMQSRNNSISRYSRFQIRG